MGRLKNTVALALLPALAQGAAHFVTVAGLGGEAEYEQRFTSLAKEADKILRGSGGDNRIHTLSGPDATREKLSGALAAVAKEAKPDDQFALLLIGHGSFDGSDYKFNLKGPDVTAIELAAMCDRIQAGKQLVVNATSASGGSLHALQRANRAVITATKSGTEKNATVFARYWVEALRDPNADTDKNEAISALEAYRFADQKTTNFYETAKRLATEHPMLEDTGNGEATRTPGKDNDQGMLAARIAVVRIGAAQKAAADPAKRELLAKKEALEVEIDALKRDKAAMPTAEYRKKLASLLLGLAKLQEEIDK
ncbi:MAG: hypothetical protein FJW39_01900 [Acidobacteria bacterium]|nr:hypothetical protein [Acidobacteriota bacterium]